MYLLVLVRVAVATLRHDLAHITSPNIPVLVAVYLHIRRLVILTVHDIVKGLSNPIIKHFVLILLDVYVALQRLETRNDPHEGRKGNHGQQRPRLVIHFLWQEHQRRRDHMFGR